MHRRNLLKASGLGLALAANSCTSTSKPQTKSKKQFPFKKSFCYWPYKDMWSIDQMISIAKKMDCDGIELVPPKYWGKLKDAGLECSLSTSHSFTTGMNDPTFHLANISKIKERIDLCKQYNFPSVITFVGFSDNTDQGGAKISASEGIKNCIQAYEQVLPYAEKQGITLQMEILNSRVSTSMKGHPGFAGDTVEYCGEIIRHFNSDHFKLLFDIYHVQVMQGDLITRINDNMDIIGHVHTAGCPGRNELDNSQEINYPAVIQALNNNAYKGYLTHEFLPTKNAELGLSEAFETCSIEV
ncbi:TIM barrel protein [Lentisphaera profundi]|uniref:TIM barrel protein n=1 Tax=Lentisphaera profundi TaxID=1658616 RepID=A0ABY7VWX5_9BACT|nr:TIM barrel protein [Lentisphaera profundi]WDE98751.1 TIM barrel protein [Lentisphaera profundi]